MFRSFIKRVSKKFKSKKRPVQERYPLLHKLKPGLKRQTPPCFAIGTGRCGTHFLYTLMREDPQIKAYHTDTIGNQRVDSFVRYVQWYGLPIDISVFFALRRGLVQNALEDGKVYFEANAYTSLAAKELRREFGARIVLMVRSPEKVVNSHFIKGWYNKLPYRSNPDLPPLLQPGRKPHHVLGRPLPLGEDFNRWERLTRIGKISWWWNAFTMKVLNENKAEEAGQFRIQRLEDIDYNYYQELHSWIGGKNRLSKDDFDSIRNSRPGKGKAKRTVADWSEQERREFEAETLPARSALSELGVQY